MNWMKPLKKKVGWWGHTWSLTSQFDVVNCGRWKAIAFQFEVLVLIVNARVMSNDTRSRAGLKVKCASKKALERRLTVLYVCVYRDVGLDIRCKRYSKSYSTLPLPAITTLAHKRWSNIIIIVIIVFVFIILFLGMVTSPGKKSLCDDVLSTNERAKRVVDVHPPHKVFFEFTSEKRFETAEMGLQHSNPLAFSPRLPSLVFYTT